MKEKNYYEIIGVSIFADENDIRDEYLKKIKMYHPDTYQGKREYAESVTAELNIAYATLKDPQKKLEYDIKNGIFKKREDERNLKNKLNSKEEKRKEKQKNKIKKEQFKRTQKEAKQRNKHSDIKSQGYSKNDDKKAIKEKRQKEREEKKNILKEKLFLDIVIISLLVIVILLIIFK